MTNGARVIDSQPPAIASRKLARLDRPRRLSDRVEPRGAKAVDRHARNGVRQAREQERHAGEIAIVLARLVRRAENDVLDPFGETRMAAHQLANRDRREVVGAHGRERAAVASDRRADVIADEGFGHGRGLQAVMRRTGAMRKRLATKAASVSDALPAGLPPVT